MKELRIYLIGPISGYESTAPMRFEWAKRNAMAIMERKPLPDGVQIVVVSPLELPHNHDKSWGSYMLEDLAALHVCDTILMMPGWKESVGAKIEHAFAAKEGKTIIDLLEGFQL